MTRKSAPKKTQAKRPKVVREPVKSYFTPPEPKRPEATFPVIVAREQPVVIVVGEKEMKAIPVPRSAMGQVYDFLAGLVK